MVEQSPRLTKYECSRILGIRAAQISMSAPVLLDIPHKYQSNFLLIAAMELKAQVLDIIVRRPLPMNRYYEVNVKNMALPDDLDTLIRMYQKSTA